MADRCFFVPLFLIGKFETDREGGWESERTACSIGLHVGIEPRLLLKIELLHMGPTLYEASHQGGPGPSCSCLLKIKFISMPV